MLSKAFPLICLVPLSVGAGCACPQGNAVEAARLVQAGFQLASSTVAYTGNASSRPGGGAIAFDRSTILEGSSPGPASRTDLAVYMMAPGCHPDASGATICDWSFDLAVTVHGVPPHPTVPLTIALDDRSAAAQVNGQFHPTPVYGPCPDKPGLADAGVSCVVSTDPPASGYVPYSGIQGQLTLTSLDENCTDVLSVCALTAAGTFELAATGPAGESLSLSEGTIAAADTLMYRQTCPN